MQKLSVATEPLAISRLKNVKTTIVYTSNISNLKFLLKIWHKSSADIAEPNLFKTVSNQAISHQPPAAYQIPKLEKLQDK